MTTEKKTGLALLREPFAAHQISKLPKPTKAQTDQVKADFKAGVRCDVCGGWHHPKVVHLDYVGHAALTDRLLDADFNWIWEPLSVSADGLPVIDKDGGLWIKLTVCGVTRLGYGDAQGKTGGDAMKERIGDALRNAAMRFGAALDLWHKGDLHLDDDSGKDEDKGTQKPVVVDQRMLAVLQDLTHKAKADMPVFLDLFKIKSLAEMPVLEYPKAVEKLEKKIASMPVPKYSVEKAFAEMTDDLPY